MQEIIRVLPAAALRGTTILPGMIVHFDITREKSIRAVEKVMLQDQELFLVTQREPETKDPGMSDVYRVGIIASVKQVMRLRKDTLRVIAEGRQRARLLAFLAEEPYLLAQAAVYEEEEDFDNENAKEAALRSLKELFHAYCVESGKLSRELIGQIMKLTDIGHLVDQISINLPLAYTDRQKILEALTIPQRCEVVGTLMTNEIEIHQIRQDIQQRLKNKVDKNQREYILREQLKLIREELGEDSSQADVEKYRKQLEKLEASDEVKEKISKEIEKLKNLGNSPSEAAVSRGYIETLLGLPWDKKSEDSKDLKKAFKILEEDHYGLEKVKERIMEYLAVRTLTKKGESPILCLVGPPGTGKTSIAKSVARALHKKYVRICLGGVRDEAEIRGHRRTYIGSIPGRITAGLAQAQVANPLLLLDEIDKTGADYKGDVASALLEVLDPEQNQHFSDHYVEIPQDLSEVLFIATANDAQKIPRPLLDRMEILEISGYTENEKEHIAREHLVKKQLKANGLKKGQLSIRKGALKKIITGYTREAGVRSLEREIARICRKAVRKILEEGEEKLVVTAGNLEGYLGKERYTHQLANKKDEVGIVRGLAWTSLGGDTLQIEVNVMPGKGELLLTGQLGDVMQESAKTGISYIRSVAPEYEVEPEFFRENDIHIHIPEGAVPKDGPSAGITMATAMLSAITQKPVHADVAMTGEITLRGRVLPIGGLKEKLLAAKEAQIQKVLVPVENKKDVAEMSEEITGGLQIVYVDAMGEVLRQALCE